jgi:hypothetical protein
VAELASAVHRLKHINQNKPDDFNCSFLRIAESPVSQAEPHEAPESEFKSKQL